MYCEIAVLGVVGLLSIVLLFTNILNKRGAMFLWIFGVSVQIIVEFWLVTIMYVFFLERTVDWKPIPLVDNKILSFIGGGFARGILLVIKCYCLLCVSWRTGELKRRQKYLEENQIHFRPGGGDPYTDPYIYRGNAPPNYAPPGRPGYFNSRPPPSIDEESPPSFTSGSEIKIPRPKVYR
ncbi:uncharacterized protein [Branchiostoma lanceolatum]|uniref:uncharacterized protein isoform X2 n=1 Tax=Branchiostoma lanceolatum TaxID=7740 RepID=UPI0034536FB9